MAPKLSHNEPAIVVGKAYDFVLWLLPKAEKFQRSYRFSLGDRVVSCGLDLLLLLVGAAYTADKEALLEQASQKVNMLRYLLRGKFVLTLPTCVSLSNLAPEERVFPRAGAP